MGAPQIIMLSLTLLAVLVLIRREWKKFQVSNDINEFLGACIGGLLHHAGIIALLWWGGFFSPKC